MYSVTHTINTFQMRSTYIHVWVYFVESWHAFTHTVINLHIYSYRRNICSHSICLYIQYNHIQLCLNIYRIYSWNHSSLYFSWLYHDYTYSQHDNDISRPLWNIRNDLPGLCILIWRSWHGHWPHRYRFAITNEPISIYNYIYIFVLSTYIPVVYLCLSLWLIPWPSSSPFITTLPLPLFWPLLCLRRPISNLLEFSASQPNPTFTPYISLSLSLSSLSSPISFHRKFVYPNTKMHPPICVTYNSPLDISNRFSIWNSPNIIRPFL